MAIEIRHSPSISAERFHRPWGCPLTRNRTNHCFALCAAPDGIGFCGRVAPHRLEGRTTRAILAHQARRAAR